MKALLITSVWENTSSVSVNLLLFVKRKYIQSRNQEAAERLDDGICVKFIIRNGLINMAHKLDTFS